MSSTQKNLFKNTLEIHVYSAKSPKITTESTNMRSDRKARISGLAGTEHARNRTNFTRSPFRMTVGDLGTRLSKCHYHESLAQSCTTVHNRVTLAHRSNRSNHPHKFRHIFARTNASKFSFFPVVIPLWNGLSMAAVLNAESVTAFKTNALPTIRKHCNTMKIFICCK